MLDEYERGWLEAAIDGEGSIYLRKVKNKRCRRGFSWNVKVTLCNTNREFLEKAAEICGINTRINRYKFKNKTYKDLYKLEIPSVVLREILPQLKFVIKEEQRVLMLEALRLLKEHVGGYTPNDMRLEKIYEYMKWLNGKGEKLR